LADKKLGKFMFNLYVTHNTEISTRDGKLSSLVIAPIILALISIGCAKSPAPSVEDIVKVARPTFSGSTDVMISSPTQTYALIGKCDMAAEVTEYSYDQVTWTPVTCVAKQFTINLVLTGYLDVFARSKGKFSYTETSKARVRFLLPQTTDAIMAVTSSQSDPSDSIGEGQQSMISQIFEGNILEDASHRIQTLLPRIVYED
jgi:hypothetical protein